MSSDPFAFYRRLPVRTHFVEALSAADHAPLPPDWVLAVGDVADSTGAIARGQYRDVNMAGGALLAAVFNAIGHHDFPFVFGGDGATAAVPPAAIERVRAALAATRAMAARAFGLDLRVGLIPVADVLAAGQSVAVARVRMSETMDLAAWSGTGPAWAERLLKSPATAPQYQIAAADDGGNWFAGLECRWDPIRSPRGETLALLVLATGAGPADEAATYLEVLAEVEAALGPAESHPVSDPELRLTHDPQRLRGEAALRAPQGGWRQALWWRRIRAETWAGRLLMQWGPRLAGVRWGEYRADILRHSDYRKFDGMLRMVVSATAAGRERLARWLAEAEEAGRLVHGLHVSDRALMTCLVFRRQGGHLHFIDAADGGYAMAAKQLKQRLRTRAGA